jgi:hypothetical protein
MAERCCPKLISDLKFQISDFRLKIIANLTFKARHGNGEFNLRSEILNLRSHFVHQPDW